MHCALPRTLSFPKKRNENEKKRKKGNDPGARVRGTILLRNTRSRCLVPRPLAGYRTVADPALPLGRWLRVYAGGASYDGRLRRWRAPCGPGLIWLSCHYVASFLFLRDFLFLFLFCEILSEPQRSLLTTVALLSPRIVLFVKKEN